MFLRSHRNTGIQQTQLQCCYKDETKRHTGTQNCQLTGIYSGKLNVLQIDVDPLLSGFLVPPVKHLPINNKARHCDLKGKCMHQLQLDMDVHLLWFCKVLGERFLPMAKPSLPL